MKQILLLTAILISNVTFGQNFPANYVNLLLNKEIKVQEKDVEKYGYYDFYVNSKLKKIYACSEGYYSKYSELVGKVFKVLSAEPYKNSIGTDKYKLKIENPEIGTIYFDYDPNYEHQFPFEVIGGLNLPEGYYCKGIKTTIDKFDGEKTIRSDYSEGISFTKFISKGTFRTYISVRGFGSTISIGKKGLILLLKNGKKIVRADAEIEISVGTGDSYNYSAFTELTNEEIDLIINNPITDKRLYIYDGQIKNGVKLSEYLKCMSK